MMYSPALKTAAFITRHVCHRKTIKLQESGQGSRQHHTPRIHMWNPWTGPAESFQSSTKGPGASSTSGLPMEQGHP